MPKCLEPNQKFPIVLDFDMDKPENERPTFYVRSLSSRGQSQLAAELDESMSHDTTDEILTATFYLLSKHLTGWKNLGEFEFGCDPQEFLSHEDARELLRKILINQHLASDEKKG